MSKPWKLTVLILLFIGCFIFATACTYDLTLKSTFTHALPSQQPHDDQRQQQQREDAARNAGRL